MKREDFLRRVREATGRAPEAPLSPPPAPIAPPRPAPDRRTLAERFKREHEAVLGRAHLVETAEEARAVLADLLRDHRTVARSPHALLDEVGLADAAPHLRPAPPADADVGVTGAEFGIAATGSVALSSSWGRLAALLPDHHVVVLRASRLVPDVEDAYLGLDAAAMPGAWGFHTGPSKSADIEQTMALGVHGPGRVDVLVILD